MPRTKPSSQELWMPREALPPDAVVRLDHAGEWVAWDHEMQRAIATGLDREIVRAAALAAGVVRPICEWVPPVPTRPDDYAG